MKANGLILIAFILLKCGSRVIGEKHESDDEDINSNHTEVTREVKFAQKDNRVIKNF